MPLNARLFVFHGQGRKVAGKDAGGALIETFRTSLGVCCRVFHYTRFWQQRQQLIFRGPRNRNTRCTSPQTVRHRCLIFSVCAGEDLIEYFE